MLLATAGRTCGTRACYVLSSITVMNRFSHVDLAALPFPPRMRGGGKGGTLMPVIAGARGAPPCAPPAPPLPPPCALPFPPPCGGERGGRLHRARVNDCRARRRRAPPPFPPLRGVRGGAASGRAAGRLRSKDRASAREPRTGDAAGSWQHALQFMIQCRALHVMRYDKNRLG